MLEISFTVGHDQVRGRMHIPESKNESVPGVLILPGFADTAVGPHNMHVQTAFALEKSGYAVMRFDYRGQGESDGDFTRFTIQSGFEDVCAAYQEFCQHPNVDENRLGVIGYSLGGMYAIELASQFDEIKALGLLAPVAFPEKVFSSFFNEEHMKQAEQEGWIDWMGWGVGQTFLQNLNVMNPLISVMGLQESIKIFHGIHDEEVPRENAEAFAESGIEVEWLENLGHDFGSVVKKQRIINEWCHWFKTKL